MNTFPTWFFLFNLSSQLSGTHKIQHLWIFMYHTISWGEYIISGNMELSLASRINVNKTKSLVKWEGARTAFLGDYGCSCSRTAALQGIGENSCRIQRAASLRRAHHYFMGNLRLNLLWLRKPGQQTGKHASLACRRKWWRKQKVWGQRRLLWVTLGFNYCCYAPELLIVL